MTEKIEFSLSAKQVELREMLKREAMHDLLYGGSRSGKTFLFCYAIAARALRAAKSRHGIFRKTGVAVKQSIGTDTFPKMMSLAFPKAGYRWYEQDGYFKFSNKSEVWLAGLDDKERLDKVLGKEFATIYENEASEISYDAHLTLMTRLAQRVKTQIGTAEYLPLKNYIDLNPTTQSHWTYKLFVQGIEPLEKRPIRRDDYEYAVVNPEDNAENLDPAYIEGLKLLPKAKRSRFYLGRYTGDDADALWARSTIDDARMYVRDDEQLPDFRRIVVAIDPAISSDDGANETGIIVASVDGEGKGFVLADASGHHKPNEWATKALTLYKTYQADAIVAEANQGGEMVEAVIHSQNPHAPVKLVKASRGKYVRAEPVAALYARGRVRHVGEFETLEDQMCTFTADFDRKAQGYSPDRVDALVWAMTDLFPGLISDRVRRHSRTAVADGMYNELESGISIHDMRRQQAYAVGDYDEYAR